VRCAQVASWSCLFALLGGSCACVRAGQHPLAPRLCCALSHDSDNLVQSAVLTRRNLHPSDTRARQHGRFFSLVVGSLALARMLGLFLPAFANATSPTDHQIGVRRGNRAYRDGHGFAGDHRGASLRNALEAPAAATLRHRNWSPSIRFLESDVRHRRQPGPRASRHPRGVARPQDCFSGTRPGGRNVMNDRQWNVSAYAALALVFVIAITTAVMITDQLAHAI
jgi:hypothetical protein